MHRFCIDIQDSDYEKLELLIPLTNMSLKSWVENLVHFGVKGLIAGVVDPDIAQKQIEVMESGPLGHLFEDL